MRKRAFMFLCTAVAATLLTRISHRSQETRLRGARGEIFGVWGRRRLSVGPP